MVKKLENNMVVNGQPNINVVLIVKDQKVSLKNNTVNMGAKNNIY
jgi:hypothetical protein